MKINFKILLRLALPLINSESSIGVDVIDLDLTMTNLSGVLLIIVY